MAIQVNTNEPLISSRTRIGRWATLAGLAIVFGGVFASLNNSILIAYGALIVGFVLSNIGTYFLNRYGLGEYKKLEEALKGFDKRYRLYNFLLPVRHVMLTPYGVTVFLLKNQDGKITGTDKGWKEQAGIVRFFRSFSTEPLNDPPKELAAQKEQISELVQGELGEDVKVPIEGFIVFTNPKAQVTLSGVKAPVVILNKQPDGLKNALRRDKRTPTLPAELYNKVQAVFDMTADEKMAQSEKGWKFWQR